MRDWEQEASVLKDQYWEKISKLTNERMEECFTISAVAALRGPLQIIFGNGSEVIKYRGHYCLFNQSVLSHGDAEIIWADDAPDDAWTADGEWLNPPEELAFLISPLKDVVAMTDGYRDGCPESIDIKEGLS